MKAVMQLKDYTIDKLNFIVNEDSYVLPVEQRHLDTPDEYEFDHEVYRSDGSNTFLVKFITRCNDSEEALSNHTISFVLEMKGIFIFDDGTSEETIERMIHLNCVSILYGLTRGIIAQTSAHTALGKIVLPSINFIEYFRNKHKELEAPEKRTLEKKAPAKKKAPKKKAAKK